MTYEPPTLKTGMRTRVYWITRRIAQGQFATPERAAVLREQGVTSVLNVGEAASIITAEEYGFMRVVDCPVVDLARIPDDIATAATDALHELLAAPDAKVFIHCIAGQNRSPTILWLYFVACGLTPETARELIAPRSPDAIPGHGKLVDAALVEHLQEHGKKYYLPLADGSVLEAAY